MFSIQKLLQNSVIKPSQEGVEQQISDTHPMVGQGELNKTKLSLWS